VKIALAQINTTVADFTGNAAKIVDFSRQAQARGAELVIFPELSVCGYPPRDMVERPAFVARNLKTVEHIAAQTSGISVICGFVTPAAAETGKAVMNSAALLKDGKVAFVQSKMLLPTYDVFDESRNFAPASGQELFCFGGKKIALTICEDAWNDKHYWPHRLYAVDPVDELIRRGGEFIINISSSPFQLGKRKVRQDMLATIARDNNMPVVLVNQVGGNDAVVFDGTSMVLSATGELVARAKSFEEDLVLYETDTGEGEIHHRISGDEATSYAALVLGTRDYVRKCGFQKVVIGLSGGIDSAVTASIAVDALGAENVTGIGMPGPYSSKGSIDDAHRLADKLGIRFELIPITGMYQRFAEAMREPFTGTKPDATEENMQSRCRGNVLMAWSNKFDALVLTTGNKSEYAVGYCTLYGDMAGALAVIADVPKTMVYRIAKYVNESKAREVIPVNTIEKPPSAELRPEQLDTDSLPSYPVLDTILEEYVEEYKTVREIAAEHGFEEGLVLRIVRMIDRSEYKRQQAPLGLKISRKAFGVGRRFPIAAKYELQEER
jgi:NAD+ synthase (glutamine-hydrolysing)